MEPFDPGFTAQEGRSWHERRAGPEDGASRLAPGWDWISTLGPYNEHLVRDYGAMNLALGVLLVSAAISPERRLSQVALLTYLAFALPHFVFHAAQTHHFTLFHNALQLGSLGLLVLLPGALLVLATLSVAHIRVRPAESPSIKEE